MRNAAVPLTEEDFHDLHGVMEAPTALAILASFTPGTIVNSDACQALPEGEVLHALVRVGLRAVQREALNEIGYRQLAHDTGHQKHAYTVTSNRHLRRRPRHAADE